MILFIKNPACGFVLHKKIRTLYVYMPSYIKMLWLELYKKMPLKFVFLIPLKKKAPKSTKLRNIKNQTHGLLLHLYVKLY